MAMTRCLGCGTPNQRLTLPTLRMDVTTAHRHGLRHGVCGSTQRLEVHHVIELVRGGSNELSNLELLCTRCHRLCSLN